MPLTVLNVAFSLAPVSASAAGGAEQIVKALDGALVSEGHTSIVLASEGSSVSGELWKIPATHGRVLDPDLRCQIQQAQRSALHTIIQSRNVDLVHMHGVDFYRYLPEPGIPVLVTLHLPLDWYPPHIFHPARPDTYLNCVSVTQQRSLPAAAAPVPVIENGVFAHRDVPVYRKRAFAAALGRICPEKGYHLALGAAKRARVDCLLAGRIFRYPEHERYFAGEIVPRLDRGRRFIGGLGPTAKKWLLGSAQCLLVPSLAPETSSLVSMEALACGTPVVAFRSGALTEVIEHGKTGFLVSNEVEMSEAIPATRDLDPDGCRETAQRRFSLRRMTEAYLALYARLASTATLWPRGTQGRQLSGT